MHKWCVQLLKSIDEGAAGTEASFKMAIADSMFDDLIETQRQCLDAHGLQELSGDCSSD